MAETRKPASRRSRVTDPESPPRRVTERLKAERIQGAAASARIDERLKAERIQGLLAELPGWRLAAGGSALERVHRFPSPRAAAAFVALAAEIGAADGFLPELDLRRREVTERIAADAADGLTRCDFDRARQFSL